MHNINDTEQYIQTFQLLIGEGLAHMDKKSLNNWDEALSSQQQ